MARACAEFELARSCQSQRNRTAASLGAEPERGRIRHVFKIHGFKIHGFKNLWLQNSWLQNLQLVTRSIKGSATTPRERSSLCLITWPANTVMRSKCLATARYRLQPRAVWSRTAITPPDLARRVPIEAIYSGRCNSPVRSFVTSGNFSGSGTSQSMQRNLRPPVLTSMKRIGLLHFGHGGGAGFLGIGVLAWLRRERNTLSHR